MRYFLCVIALLFLNLNLVADALIVTRAMKAPTIFEIFINDNKLRLEIEMSNELTSFQNILPDELCAALKLPKNPLKQRLQDFYSTDLPIYADGKLLEGRLVSLGARERVVRDEISGAITAKSKQEPALFIVLEYDLPDKPSELHFQRYTSPKRLPATIGFACYHEGIMLNPFSYYDSMTLTLDNVDPWYSQFQSKSLRRKQFTPVLPFIYVDNYEVRKEIVARIVDLNDWVDLGLEGKSVLTPKHKLEIIAKVTAFLDTKNPLSIDGELRKGSIERIKFIQRGLQKTSYVEESEEIDVISATLGVITTYPVEKLPKRVEMTWELIPEKIETLMGTTVDQAGPFSIDLSKEDNILVWENFLQKPRSRGLVEIDAEPLTLVSKIPVYSYVISALAVILFIYFILSAKPLKAVPTAALVLAAVAFMLRGTVVERVSIDENSLSMKTQKKVMSQLLYNIYRSFDLKKDEQIYDSLSQSAHGDLLSDIFLNTKKALEVRDQGGSRVKVTDLRILEFEPSDDETSNNFNVNCHWEVSGEIGHWGHVHKRINKYVADIGVDKFDSAWKISNFDLHQEVRMQKVY